MEQFVYGLAEVYEIGLICLKHIQADVEDLECCVFQMPYTQDEGAGWVVEAAGDSGGSDGREEFCVEFGIGAMQNFS